MKKVKALFSNIIELFKNVKFFGFSYLLRLGKAKKTADQIIPGFFLTHVVNCLLNVGFFEKISNKGMVNLELFSKEKNLDKRILELLCDYLFTLRILKKNKLDYSLTKRGKFIIEMLSGVFRIIYSFEDIFHNLESLLKKEKNVDKDAVINRKFEAKGTGETAKLLPFPIIIGIINKRKLNRVFDIGCGSATLLIELCKNNSEIIGYGVDNSAEAINCGNEQITEGNLKGRITLFKGNILRDFVNISGELDDIDIITATFVLHELFFEQKEKLINFLKGLRERFNNKPLMICENIKQGQRSLYSDPGLYSELQLAHGIVREQQMTREEWKEVFVKSGFNQIEERFLSFAKIAIYLIR